MIVSTTLTGSNADIIGDALASVLQQVDRCIVIDTGAKDDTIAVARRVAGDKLLLREFPWKNDFAAARNYALEAATEAGATWAVTLDTDERLLFDRDFDLARTLARTQAQVCMVLDDSRQLFEGTHRARAGESATGKARRMNASSDAPPPRR